MNKIQLRGVIVNKNVMEKATVLTIMTGRHFPKVLCFHDKKEQVDRDFNQGDHVSILANMQSTKRKARTPENENKRFRSQSIFLDSIQKTAAVPSEFNEGENVYPAPLNMIQLSGNIVKIQSPVAGLVNMTIRCMEKNYFSFVKTVYYAEDVAAVLNKFHVGDFVEASGYIKTPRKVKNGTRVDYENVLLKTVKKQEAEKEA